MLAHQMGGVAEKVSQIVFVSDIEDTEIGTNFLGERTIDQNTITGWSKEAAELRGSVMTKFSAGGSVTIHRSPKMHRAQLDDQKE